VTVLADDVFDVLSIDAEAATPPVFARHETFAPRPGWLKKGFDAANRDESFFVGDTAPLELGVGKNMGRAIRYWCHAFKVLDDERTQGRRAVGSRPSALGQRLLRDDGWDPFLEDAGSLWYLHWKLLEAPSQATAWRFAFTIFPERDFTVEQLDLALQSFVARAHPTARAAASSLHKDALCIVRMYSVPAPSGTPSEESISSPFSELGLIRPGPDARTYAFDIGSKPHLPASVAVACCLEFASTIAPGARTVALGRLLFDYGSPGMAFKLTEAALVDAIEEVSEQTRSVRLSDTAGLVQMAFDAAPEHVAADLLTEHFSSTGATGGTR
jgi:hypothetical protein